MARNSYSCKTAIIGLSLSDSPQCTCQFERSLSRNKSDKGQARLPGKDSRVPEENYLLTKLLVSNFFECLPSHSRRLENSLSDDSKMFRAL